MKTPITNILLCLLMIGFASNKVSAQEELKRQPVWGKLGLSQKSFRPAEITIPKNELGFIGKSSHGLGLAVGANFGLNYTDFKHPYWQLNSTFYIGTAPLIYSAVLPAEQHGLDEDAPWVFHRFSATVEGYLGLSRMHPLNDKWLLKFGFGINVSDVYIRQKMLNQSILIKQNGASNNILVIGQENFFFGFNNTP